MAKYQPCYRVLHVENYKWKSLDDNLFSWFCSAFMLSLMLAGIVAAPDDRSVDRPFFIPLLTFTIVTFGFVVLAKLIAIATYTRRKITGAAVQFLERCHRRLVPLLISYSYLLKPSVRKDCYDCLRYILFVALVERIPLDNTLDIGTDKIEKLLSAEIIARRGNFFPCPCRVTRFGESVGLENKLKDWLEESCMDSDFPNTIKVFSDELLWESRYIIDSSEHADSDLIANTSARQELLQSD